MVKRQNDTKDNEFCVVNFTSLNVFFFYKNRVVPNLKLHSKPPRFINLVGSDEIRDYVRGVAIHIMNH